MDVTHQSPLFMGFSKQEYSSELPHPRPRDPPKPGTQLLSPVSPALQEDTLPTKPGGKPSHPAAIFKNSVFSNKTCYSLSSILWYSLFSQVQMPSAVYLKPVSIFKDFN